MLIALFAKQVRSGMKKWTSRRGEEQETKVPKYPTLVAVKIKSIQNFRIIPSGYQEENYNYIDAFFKNRLPLLICL